MTVALEKAQGKETYSDCNEGDDVLTAGESI